MAVLGVMDDVARRTPSVGMPPRIDLDAERRLSELRIACTSTLPANFGSL